MYLCIIYLFKLVLWMSVTDETVLNCVQIATVPINRHRVIARKANVLEDVKMDGDRKTVQNVCCILFMDSNIYFIVSVMI